MPEDCAALFLFLASDASEFITGQVISPNGGGLIIENMIGVNRCLRRARQRRGTPPVDRITRG